MTRVEQRQAAVTTTKIMSFMVGLGAERAPSQSKNPISTVVLLQARPRPFCTQQKEWLGRLTDGRWCSDLGGERSGFQYFPKVVAFLVPVPQESFVGVRVLIGGASPTILEELRRAVPVSPHFAMTIGLEQAAMVRIKETRQGHRLGKRKKQAEGRNQLRSHSDGSACPGST